PAVARDHDVRILVDDERVGVELDLLARAAGLGPARRAELERDAAEVVLDDAPQLGLAAEDRLDPLRLGGLLLELLADHVDLELRELVQLELEDRVGLELVELEPLDDLLGGVVLALARADDLDDLVERIEDRDEALEDVDPIGQLL